MMKRITFTGVDQWTKAKDVEAIYKDFPFVEFGFLLSESRKAGNRYPQPVIFKAYKKTGIPMAMHICGKYSYEYARTGDWRPIADAAGSSIDMFDRIQLNIPKISRFSRDIIFPEGKKIIFQIHEGTKDFFACYKDRPEVQGFQDGSGGHGVVCTEWMPPESSFFGYAGGICPENVVETIRAISAVCPTDFWIDMETGVRTDYRFDVEKCRRVCESVVKAGFIAP